jgi:hypothetical protein
MTDCIRRCYHDAGGLYGPAWSAFCDALIPYVATHSRGIHSRALRLESTIETCTTLAVLLLRCNRDALTMDTSPAYVV